ncbi:MAG: hypothetical protein WBD20_12855 [Pirellulaceae bacterium]
MRSILIVLLASTTIVAQEKNGVDDSTGKVFSSIADFTLNRDEVSSRYGFLAVGEVQNGELLERGKAPRITQGYWFRAGNRRPNYSYYSQVIYNESGSQEWREFREASGKISMRRVSRVRQIATPYIDKKNDESILDFQSRVVPIPFLDPFDDVFSSVNLSATFQDKNVAETWFLKLGELKSSVLIGGKLVTKWYVPQYQMTINMTQDQSVGLMPVEIETIRTTKYKRKEISHIKWAKKDGLYVPTHIRGTSESLLGTVSHYYKLTWLLGEKAPVTMFDTDVFDTRPQVAEPFDFQLDAMVGGAFVRGTPYEPPSDLFVDEEEEVKK